MRTVYSGSDYMNVEKVIIVSCFSSCIKTVCCCFMEGFALSYLLSRHSDVLQSCCFCEVIYQLADFTRCAPVIFGGRGKWILSLTENCWQFGICLVSSGPEPTV